MSHGQYVSLNLMIMMSEKFYDTDASVLVFHVQVHAVGTYSSNYMRHNLYM